MNAIGLSTVVFLHGYALPQLVVDAQVAQLVDDAQCRGSSHIVSSDSSDRSADCDGGRGWLKNSTHATTTCNMPVLNVGAEGSSSVSLVQRLAAATTPLLIRGLVDFPGWRSQADTFGNRSTLMETFGDERMQLSVGKLLSNGPESTTLDGKKLSFMQEAWGAAGNKSVLGSSVRQQVQAGKPRPTVGLADWLEALRAREAPPDAYVFQNVSGGAVEKALVPLHTLWRDLVFEQFALHRRSPRLFGSTHEPPPTLVRLGIGGSGSGAPFHDHDVLALNVAFAGRKRWLVTQPCRPNCQIPFFKGGAAVYHPEKLLNEAQLPSAALRQLANGESTWDCTQHPGEMVFVPEGFLHATINLEESVAVAVQCDDGADPRTGLSHLNALIVHASGSVATVLGPCGTQWVSPFSKDEVGADKALGMLEKLSDSFRGDPSVFLNRAAQDGRAPLDIVVRYGSAQVASVLAAQGARFLPRHLAQAQAHGHAALVEFIGNFLKA